MSTVSHRSARRAFTLVELLVVIGIIALLISILLPSLNAARKSANTVKCQASLRQIGLGFQLYSQQYNGWYPSARDRAQALANQHAWTDLIAPFVTGKKTGDVSNYVAAGTSDDIRRRSVLWGCPEWTKGQDYDKSQSTTSAEIVYNGYGMQYYSQYYQQNNNGLLLVNTTSYATRPGYVKASVWIKNGTERGLIADSRWDIIQVSDHPFSIATNFWPYNPNITASTSPLVTVDARHAKAGTSQYQAGAAPSLNMLFCDGHVAMVSAGDAQRAIRSPGMQKLPKDP